MSITASELRRNIYKLLDEVIESGKPLQVKRKGGMVEIKAVPETGKLAQLTKHDCMVGDPESIVHIDWSEECNLDLP